jgi:hypothetical protein
MDRRLLYAFVALFALSVAVFCYRYFGCPAMIVTLQVRTYEKGVRTITVTDLKGDAYVRRFEVGNDQGEPSYYTIELPRRNIREINVEPLASIGRIEIDRITLRSERMSYSWDSQGKCVSKSMQGGSAGLESSGAVHPQLSVAENSQISLSRIPETMSRPDMVHGILAAFLGFIVTMLAGTWLIQPVRSESLSAATGVCAARFCWILLVALYFAQFSAIWRYSVDVPFWEEWEYFVPGGLPDGFSWDWLFGFSGSHRVVPTRLMAWLNLKLFGLDFWLQKLFNYAIFGCMLMMLVNLKNRVIGRQEFLLFPAFLFFYLSPIIYENHSNSYQSQIHLLIIFTLIALHHLYDKGLNIKSQVLFILCLVAAINTFAAGMTVAFLFFICWTLFVLVTIVKGTCAGKKGFSLLLLGGITVVSCGVSWVAGFTHSNGSGLGIPSGRIFWDTFLNLISFGFGFELEHPLPGTVCILVCGMTIILLLKDKEMRSRAGVWQVVTGILAVFAILATISMARGNYAGSSKISRYAEFGLLLIPLMSMACWLAFKNRVLRGSVLLVFWLICFVSFSDTWSFSSYRDAGQMELFELETLEEYLDGRGDGSFPWSFLKPLPPYFDAARRLDVKFTRQFKGFK